MSEQITRREVFRRASLGALAAGWSSYLIHSASADPVEDWGHANPPGRPPCEVYPPVPEIPCEEFLLPPEGLTPAKRRQALDSLFSYQSHRQATTLGYQANQKLAYEDDLKAFLDFHINNVGDPFQSGNFTLNSKWMERAVLDYYAKLWNAKWPHDPQNPESYWGYVLTMGSTEGNLYGLWNARDYLQGKCLLDDPRAAEEAAAASKNGEEYCVPSRILCHQPRFSKSHPNAFSPVAFYSEDTHYSVIKALRVMGIQTFYEVGTEHYPNQCPITSDKTWPKEVPSQRGGEGPGSIDLEALEKLVEFFAARGYPILVNFNYGTTFKGAYDDVEGAGKRLLPILKKHGLLNREIARVGDKPIEREGFWFHVDAALAGSFMPFVEMAHRSGQLPTRGPNFDFRLPFVHSITMSGHKWIGAPWPCGVYMSKCKYLMLPPSRPGYIGSRDSTLAGSRNGFSAMILWDYLARNSYKDQIEKAIRIENLAQYAHKQLLALEKDTGPLWVARTPMSLTMRFKRPDPQIVFKYSLANETLYVNGEKRDYSHIFIMEHVTKELIDSLIADLRKPDAFRRNDTTKAEPAPANVESLEDLRPLIYVPEFGRGFN